MKRTDRLTNLIAILLFLAFLAYAGVYVYRTLSDQTVTAEAVAASVSVGGTASGIVIRDETVLTSKKPYVDVTAADGAMVASGGQLALAMSSETGLERAGRIRELELEIARMESALGGVHSADDLTARDEKLREAVRALTGAVARHEPAAADSAALNLRSLVLGDGSTATEQELRALQTELSSLKNSSSSDTEELTAPESGMFFSLVDGYEHLSSADVYHLTPAKVRSFIDAKQEVPEGAYGKFITEYYWYFACVMSAEDAGNLTEGRRATLDFGRYYGGEITARVMGISDAENGSVAVAFRMDTALADTLSMREASASVVFEEYSGIRVPAEAIHLDGDGQTSYVWTITAMQLERKNVNILYTADGFCIVERGAAPEALRAGNTIVVAGKDLYEGKLME